MRMLVMIGLVFFAINLVLLGLAIVTGLLLRLVFPSTEWGMSVLIGLVSSVFSIRVVIKLFDAANRLGTDWPAGQARRRRCNKAASTM